MAKTMLNADGESAAHALIHAGHYDMESAWSFSAEDGDRLLGAAGDDWEKYGRWHLGEDPSEPRETKAHWKYPYGKDGKVYRRAVAAIRSRASQQGDDTVYEAAGRLMSAMDEEEGKKGATSMQTSARFSHFLAERRGEDEEAREKREAAEREANKKDTGKAETDEERAKREAEEDEAAKRARRGAKRTRKARQGERQDDDDEDGDDGADDDEEEDDEEEMKKARAADHGVALNAAFRKGARAQRRRCAAIFAHKSAAANPALAMSLAFETTMTAAAAIAVLEKTPAIASRGSVYDRMAGSAAGGVRIGAADPPRPVGPAAVAASWTHALKDFGATS